jgi:hypothetical protein
MSILSLDLEQLYDELDAGAFPSRAAALRERIEWLEALDPNEPTRGEWTSPGTSPE